MQNHYKMLIVALIAAVTLAFALLDRTSVTPETPDDAPPSIPLAGATVPNATFTRLEGGTVSLHSLSGHTVLLHFWASWCIPCHKDFTNLMERMAHDDGSTILLAVSADEKAEDAKRFLKRYLPEYQPLFDKGRVITAIDPQHKLIEGVFQTFKYPETIVIGPNLVMKKKIVGAYQ